MGIFTLYKLFNLQIFSFINYLIYIFLKIELLKTFQLPSAQLLRKR